MYRKLKCRFYPDCIDENECFFEHEDESDSKSSENEQRQSRYCPAGDKCENQSCEYNEMNHMKMKNIMCRFQSNCNRSECVFKHVIERASFLENCTQKSKRK